MPEILAPTKPIARWQADEAADVCTASGSYTPEYSTLVQETHAFLHALWGDKPSFELMLFRLPSESASWHPTLDGAAQAAVSAAGRHNVYTGIGLQRSRPPKGRGKGETVGALAGMWADIDYRSPAHKAANLPPTEADALALLAEIPLEPTVLVHSGHGLQAWWLFREPWVFDSDAERQEAAELAWRWQTAIKGKAAVHDWHVDGVADLARMLRVPGTVNRKPNCEPVPVRILILNDLERYTRDDFDPYLADLPDSRGNGRTPDSPRQVSIVLELPKAAAALAGLSPARADGYQSWLEVGMALSELGDPGLALWDDWSRQNAKYTPGVCEEKWGTFEPGCGYTLASLHHWASLDSPDGGSHKFADETLAKGAAKPETDAPNSGPGPRENLTDLGNARRLVRRHGHDLRYCDPLGGWLFWDSRRWAVDTTGEAVRRAKDTVRAIYAEAAQATDDDSRKRLAMWAMGSESASRIRAMLELAHTELEVIARAGDFDADPWLFNCQNGTVDLHTGELRPHDRRDLLTKLAPVDFEPGLTDPVFEKYLTEATAGDSEFADYLQKAVGYTLTGVTDNEDVFLLLGPGNSGKTTLAEAMLHTWGDYAHKASFTTFLARNSPLGEGDPPRADLVQMRGARLVAASEPEKGRRLAASTVKEMSGGDQVTARLPYAKQAVTYMPAFKLWLAANNAPTMDDDDSGLWRRLKHLAFTKVVPEEDRDPALKKYLQGDGRAAVLAWAVRGCLAWQREGLRPPATVRDATHSLRSSFDPLADFFDTCCYFESDEWVRAKDLRDAYVAWAKDMKARPISHKEWGQRLAGRGCTSDKKRIAAKQTRVWLGVQLSTGTDGDGSGTDGTDEGGCTGKSSLREVETESY